MACLAREELLRGTAYWGVVMDKLTTKLFNAKENTKCYVV
jgi:hypothetical protein